MRMMLKMTIPAGRGNTAYKDGSLQKAIEATMNKIKPECAYFGPSNGRRSATFVFNLEKESDIVGVLEPLWESLEPEIELGPVMTIEDLATGMQAAG